MHGAVPKHLPLAAIHCLDSSLDVRLHSGESITIQASAMSEKKKQNVRRKGDIMPETAEKIAEAMRLQRDFGYSKEKVAEVMGISNVYAGRLIKKGISFIFKGDTQEAVGMHLARLANQRQIVLQVLHSQHLLVNAGEVVTDYIRGADGQPIEIEGHRVRVPINDKGPVLAAIDRLLKIDESERKLLGLDKPTKVAPTTPDGEKSVSFVVVASPLDEQL